VRVPTGCLIGDPFRGWEIVQTILAGEHGGFGFRTTEEGTIESVLQYLREQGRQP
jgi:alkylation response protein AidB-like acyl-CoA dehydrogenase